MCSYYIKPRCNPATENRENRDSERKRAFFTHMYWDLETTMTTFKNNIILRAHLEHSELW